MEFRVLGPLEVTDGGRLLALGGPRQRLVLATLILDANHVVPTERLIDRIWGDEPPEAARNALFAYVSRLRKLLGPERIRARPPGYILLAERSEVDALRFADLVDQARVLASDPAAAMVPLTEALGLWRGEALSDLADHEVLRPAIVRLDEMRLGAIEDRLQAQIDLGNHRETIPQLESLTTEHPMRERLWSQLVLALYRSGRQGDALGAFHRARTTLLEELGIDPSSELRLLHEQVLRQDPALDHGPPATRSNAAAPDPVLSTDRGSETVESVIGTARTDVSRKGRRLRLRRFGAGIAVAGAVVLVVGGGLWVNSRRAGNPGGPWSIVVDMPLSGPAAFLGVPVRNAVQLAIDDINAAGGIGGSPIELIVMDDGHDPDRAAANAATSVADRRVVAMIGPWGSAGTFRAIPVTNAAGLLQCGPSSTAPGLTKPRYGALDLRAARPSAINFVRLAPSDDIQASAMAAFAYRDLGAAAALVIDDAAVGRDIADAFEVEYAKLGGSSVRRALNPDGDAAPLLRPLADEVQRPGLVFLAGSVDAGVAVRQAMADAGRLSVPMLSWDFLIADTASDGSSYLESVGPDAALGSYAAHAALPDQKFSFADAFRQRFGSEPDEYAAGGYACTEIVAAALRAVAERVPEVGAVREMVRAFATDPANRFATTLGTVGFDANGDALQQFVAFYRVEVTASSPAGEWILFKKQDFGPAP